MSDHVHISSFDEDDDGWPIVRCSCGFQFGPVPDMETAADVWGDHQYEVAAALNGAPVTPAERAVIDAARREQAEARAAEEIAAANAMSADLSRVAAERDAADSVIRHWHDHLARNAQGLDAVVGWPMSDWTDGEWDESGWTSAEADAIRRALDASPTEEDET